jgi:hypothetical protein
LILAMVPSLASKLPTACACSCGRIIRDTVLLLKEVL